MAGQKIKVHRSIEKLVDDAGKVTHLKCTECCWKMSVHEVNNEVPEGVYKVFSEHNCDDHRIGAAFRKVRRKLDGNPSGTFIFAP